jgi:hypothetical protein
MDGADFALKISRSVKDSESLGISAGTAKLLGLSVAVDTRKAGKLP